MIRIRRARPSDASAIGAIHVATWRSAYAGVLPEGYLRNLSPLRHALGYEQAISERRHGHAVFVAVATGEDAPLGAEEAATVVGFISGGKSRRKPEFSAGEVETLYLLDDYRERGVGRRLMRAMAAHLAAIGCRSVMLWVLKDNPTRWFYARLGGRQVAREVIRFAGQMMEQIAVTWDPIETLLSATASTPER